MKYGCVIVAVVGTLTAKLAELSGTSRRPRPPCDWRSRASLTVHDEGALTTDEVTVAIDGCAKKTRTFTSSVPPGFTDSLSASGSTTTPAARIVASVKSCSLIASRKSASARALAGTLIDDSACRAARTALMPSTRDGTIRDGSSG